MYSAKGIVRGQLSFQEDHSKREPNDSSKRQEGSSCQRIALGSRKEREFLIKLL